LKIQRLVKVSYKHTEVQTKKRLGQNFLLDANIVEKIADAATIQLGDATLEIGPGFGALTKAISKRLPRFVAVELDADLAQFIRTEFPLVNLVEQDFLTVPLSQFAQEKKLKVLGNIPYAITTPILFKLIDEREHIESAVLMMQDEVAKRLSAVPRTKEYGILAVQLQAFAKVEYLFRVSKNVFKPKPDVNSAVVRLNFYSGDLGFEIGKFRKLVRTAFRMRRKTLENNLKGFFQIHDVEFNFRQRAEELSVAEFIRLSSLVTQIQPNNTL
jgi:16S rRNA (adenine1518-N6/adenine1519-N6)-dimethyltransferase